MRSVTCRRLVSASAVMLLLAAACSSSDPFEEGAAPSFVPNPTPSTAVRATGEASEVTAPSDVPVANGGDPAAVPASVPSSGSVDPVVPPAVAPADTVPPSVAPEAGGPLPLPPSDSESGVDAPFLPPTL